MTAGCNSAHRCAPLAMCASIKDLELGWAAVTEARLTHRHPLAGEVAAAVACLCRALIRGTRWSYALCVAANDRSLETRRALETQPPKEISRSGFALEVLGAAVHFVNASDSLPIALARSIDFAGQANYCPVLVGSIGGARWGRAQIEERFLHHQRRFCATTDRGCACSCQRVVGRLTTACSRRSCARPVYALRMRAE